MAEQIDLTTPYDPTPVTAAKFLIARLDLNWRAASIVIEVFDSTSGLSRTFTYEGATATSLMVSLNKANLSTKSLQKRVLEQLVSDGKLAGTISGTPD